MEPDPDAPVRLDAPDLDAPVAVASRILTRLRAAVAEACEILEQLDQLKMATPLADSITAEDIRVFVRVGGIEVVMPADALRAETPAQLLAYMTTALVSYLKTVADECLSTAGSFAAATRTVHADR